MAELPPLPFSQDSIKWIFGVIRDESWDSCFSFLMIPNEIHEMPAGFNWKSKVAFNGVQFSLFMLYTGTCIIFQFSFERLWNWPFPLSTLSHIPDPKLGTAGSVVSIPSCQTSCHGHSWSPSLVGNKEGDCPLMQILLFQFCLDLVIWT